MCIDECDIDHRSGKTEVHTLFPLENVEELDRRDPCENCVIKFEGVRVPFAGGMARLWIRDVGDGLQIWRLPANVLDKQSRTAEKEWSYSLRVRRWINFSPLQTVFLRNVTQGLEITRIIWNDLGNWKLLRGLEH
jgi:hypothetical protein